MVYFILIFRGFRVKRSKRSDIFLIFSLWMGQIVDKSDFTEKRVRPYRKKLRRWASRFATVCWYINSWFFYLYDIFRRGKNQKVISYSIFGKEEFYYRYLELIARTAKQLYPDFIIRLFKKKLDYESIRISGNRFQNICFISKNE